MIYLNRLTKGLIVSTLDNKVYVPYQIPLPCTTISRIFFMPKLEYYGYVTLHIACNVVTEFDDHLKNTVEEMKTIMLQHKGIGLSANQIGLTKQILIIKDRHGDIYEFINPKVIESTGSALLDEGCLSAPGIFLPIVRADSIIMEYQDVTGESRKIIADGIEARTLLHEMQHLSGGFFFDNVNRSQRKAAISKLKKILK